MRLLLFIFFLLPLARAEDPLLTGPGLEIDLISEAKAITSGEPFTVGLHIHHLPGFHTYWKSPGIVGMATGIIWTLPKGFTASEIQWPYPETTFMAEYPCHGYERDVTLMVTITPPKKIETKNVVLKAETNWMCCAKGCFPGFKTFDLTLPVSDKATLNDSTQAHFAKARKELPKKDDEIKAELLSKAGAEKIKLRFSAEKSLSDHKPYFFSHDGQISSDQKQVFQSREDGSLVLEITRSEFSPKKKTSVPGVLRIDGQFFEVIAHPASK